MVHLVGASQRCCLSATHWIDSVIYYPILLLALALLIATPGISRAQEGRPCVEPTLMAIQYGDSISCSILNSGDPELFRFEGTENEAIEVLASTLPNWGTISPCIELVSPDGTTQQTCGSQTFVARMRTTLSHRGTHTIRFTSRPSSFSDGTGRYTIALERVLPPSSAATLIHYGQNVQDRLSPEGDMDLFSFAGTAGDVVNIGASNRDGFVVPCFELVGPDNSRREECAPSRLERTLTVSGTYVIVITDAVAGFLDVTSETGGYSLQLLCLAGNCSQAPVSVPGPPGQPLITTAGNLVTLSWTPSSIGVASGYLIAAGTAPGLSNVGLFNVGSLTAISAIVPGGIYYVRIIAYNSVGYSLPSAEAVVVVR